MPINATRLIDRLDRFPDVLAALAAGFSAEEWTRRPDGGAWAPAEILGHLLREEREDFRVRLRSTLEDPGRGWPPIDPGGDVERHADLARDPGEMLGLFAGERADSLAWLRSLREPDWTRAHVHPRLGPLSAGDLLASWADHDILHARQLIKRHHQFTLSDAGSFACGYAGDWTA
jgi:hypothetical protein